MPEKKSPKTVIPPPAAQAPVGAPAPSAPVRMPSTANAVADQIANNWPTFAKWVAAGFGGAIMATVSIPAAAAGGVVFAGHQAYDYFRGECSEGSAGKDKTA